MKNPAVEAVLAILPGSTPQQRLAVVHRNHPVTGSTIELRQQSWGEGIGWFTQTSVPVETHQLAGLRQSLGGQAAPIAPAAGAAQRATHLRIACAESA
ncbi:MAG: hypothetical protein KDA41_08200 [Planctomycetales bacterium]|nr:hypothetical protein [Planctomycetales bacterium]